MRELGDVADDVVARNVLADGKGDLDLCCVNSRDSSTSRMWTAETSLFGTSMPTTEILSRDGRDAHARRAERKGDVVGKVRDLESFTP